MDSGFLCPVLKQTNPGVSNATNLILNSCQWAILKHDRWLVRALSFYNVSHNNSTCKVAFDLNNRAAKPLLKRDVK